MDIDGVLIRGRGQPIPGSTEAVKQLRNARVPYAFMTNGGGVTEAAKAAQLAELLGDPTIDSSQIMLSHTPMKALAERYKGRRVMVVGSTQDTLAVAASYGFDVAGGMAIMPSQLAEGTPDIWPRRLLQDPAAIAGLPPVNANEPGAPPIEAVLLFHDPIHWGVELQVIIDVLAGGRPLGHGEAPMKQAAALYASNPDFIWQAAYPVPRFGQGAFVDCLRACWRRYSGGAELQVTEFGKPHCVQFDAVRRLVESQVGGTGLGRLYMVGDNPAADIRGANRVGDPWRSVLVRTGVYRSTEDPSNLIDPAWRVEDDLSTAVERLLATSDEEHLAA